MCKIPFLENIKFGILYVELLICTFRKILNGFFRG